jgi:hypothetical protein
MYQVHQCNDKRLIHMMSYFKGDDSLRRILRQTLKGGIILKMRVPRAQDLQSVCCKSSEFFVLS